MMDFEVKIERQENAISFAGRTWSTMRLYYHITSKAIHVSQNSAPNIQYPAELENAVNKRS
jgi:hypothetical protein